MSIYVCRPSSCLCLHLAHSQTLPTGAHNHTSQLICLIIALLTHPLSLTHTHSVSLIYSDSFTHCFSSNFLDTKPYIESSYISLYTSFSILLTHPHLLFLSQEFSPSLYITPLFPFSLSHTHSSLGILSICLCLFAPHTLFFLRIFIVVLFLSQAFSSSCSISLSSLSTLSLSLSQTHSSLSILSLSLSLSHPPTHTKRNAGKKWSTATGASKKLFDPNSHDPDGSKFWHKRTR